MDARNPKNILEQELGSAFRFLYPSLDRDGLIPSQTYSPEIHPIILAIGGKTSYYPIVLFSLSVTNIGHELHLL